VLLFNYWANETSPETKNTPNIGSAVAYFNATMRAKVGPAATRTLTPTHTKP
jgi:hypothetical protein